MDRFKKYVIKPWNSTAVLNQDSPLPRFVSEHLVNVYCTLGYTLVSALLGTFSHLYFTHGGWVTAVGFIGTLYWMSMIQPWRENYRTALLIAASYLFSSTIIPAINLIFDVNQSIIIKIIMGGIVYCSCHFGAAIHTDDRNVIYAVGEFSTPIFVTAWMIIYETYPTLLAVRSFQTLIHTLFLAFLPFPWYAAVSVLEFCRNTLQVWLNFPIHLTWITFLCYCFDYSFHDLVMVYILVLAFVTHMRIFCQEVVYIAAHHPNECYHVDTTITFFTEFVARMMSSIIHTVNFAVETVRRFVRGRAIDDDANDVE
ncbi:hypothetical protein LXL04_022827 [Taraxacum kok-saghyz]